MYEIGGNWVRNWGKHLLQNPFFVVVVNIDYFRSRLVKELHLKNDFFFKINVCEHVLYPVHNFWK